MVNCICVGVRNSESYKRTGEIRALVDVPFMVLTTSAPQVQADITNTLHLFSPIIVSCCLNRPNVYTASLSVSNIHLSVSHSFHCILM